MGPSSLASSHLSTVNTRSTLTREGTPKRIVQIPRGTGTGGGGSAVSAREDCRRKTTARKKELCMCVEGSVWVCVWGGDREDSACVCARARAHVCVSLCVYVCHCVSDCVCGCVTVCVCVCVCVSGRGREVTKKPNQRSDPLCNCLVRQVCTHRQARPAGLTFHQV